MADFDLPGCLDGGSYFSGGVIDSGSSGTNPWISGPYKVVLDHVNIAHQYADQAFDNTWCFLSALGNYAPALNELSYQVSFDDVDLPTPVFQKPDAPTLPAINITTPTFPSAFVPGDIHEFDENALGSVPEFTQPDPAINLPAKPGDLDAEAPTTPPTLTEYDFPDAVDVILPSVPSFEDLNLPTAPSVDLIDFDLDTPALPADLVPPNLVFDFQEQAYTSSLMTALTTELLDRIQNGGTGLNTDVEQAIWDRARNREDINSVRSEQQILVEQASKGFSRPSGALLAALDQLAQETQNKNADLSREIAIKQAELEQQNVQFALQTSLALEQSWLQLHNQIQQRAFEVEKYTQQALIDIYDANIRKFDVQLKIYATYSQAFEARVRAELSKVEIFKAELEGQKLIGDINLQRVELYKAQLDGIQTSVDIYRTEVDAVAKQVQSESLKIENFKALIEAYSAQVAAKRAEYDAYAASIQGEMAKTQIYDSQVKAFVSRVGAYSTQVDAETKRIDSDIQVQGLRLQEYLSKLQAISQQSSTEAAVAQSQLAAFNAQASMYTSEVQAESSRMDAEGRVYDLEIQRNRYQAEVELQNATINLENAKNSVQLILEAMKQGATVGGNLAASALSAMNIGATISGSSTDYHYYDEK